MHRYLTFLLIFAEIHFRHIEQNVAAREAKQLRWGSQKNYLILFFFLFYFLTSPEGSWIKSYFLRDYDIYSLNNLQLTFKYIYASFRIFLILLLHFYMRSSDYLSNQVYR